MTRDTPAARLIGGAWAFLRAAELLYDDAPAGEPWPTCFVNLGLAIELALKSFLRAYGGSEAQQKKLGHDLVAAFDAVEQGGFMPSHPAARDLVEALAPSYKDMSLRYLVGVQVELPPLDIAITVTRMLVMELHQQGLIMAGLATPGGI